LAIFYRCAKKFPLTSASVPAPFPDGSGAKLRLCFFCKRNFGPATVFQKIRANSSVVLSPCLKFESHITGLLGDGNRKARKTYTTVFYACIFRGRGGANVSARARFYFNT